MRWGSLVVVCLVLMPGALRAQEVAPEITPPPERPAPEAVEAAADTTTADAATEDAAGLSEDALDDLVAPIALYPDTLLTQILVAATYPLEVMKAERFLDETASLDDKARADRAEAEDWDDSVKVLASGFPDVLRRMAEEIDWTEELGDAMLADTDALLDAVQRLRAQAEAVGSLTSNDAQVVDSSGDTISIAPADPEVVYVPSYDPATTYTTAPTAAPVVYTDPGVDYGSILTTGAIAFGSAMLVNEIFDDDDDWDGDYWYGPRSIDWDDDAIYPRRDFDGDINIDRNVERTINRDIDRTNVRIGDSDRSPGERERKWEADRDRRAAAEQRIHERKGGEGARPAGDRVRPQGGADGDRRAAAEAKIKARKQGGGGQSERLKAARADHDRARPEAGRDRPAARADREGGGRDHPKASALKPSGGKPKVDAAKARSAKSLKQGDGPNRKANAPARAQSKAVHRPKAGSGQMKAPQRKAGPKSTAFKKSSGGAQRHKASANRGHKSMQKKRR